MSRHDDVILNEELTDYLQRMGLPPLLAAASARLTRG